jgi:hypothetical protein
LSAKSNRPGYGDATGAQRVKVGLACAVIVLASIWIFIMLRKPSTKLSFDKQEYIGQVAAKETARLMNGQGQIVIVTPDLARHYDLLVEAQVKGFRRTVTRSRGVNLLATEQINLTPHQRANGLSPELYFALLDKYPSADAIVSFIGVGPFTSDDLRDVPARKPVLVSVSLNAFPPHELFQAGVVQVAIGPRFDRPAASGEPKTQQEWFERNYQIVAVDSQPEY